MSTYPLVIPSNKRNASFHCQNLFQMHHLLHRPFHHLHPLDKIQPRLHFLLFGYHAPNGLFSEKPYQSENIFK